MPQLDGINKKVYVQKANLASINQVIANQVIAKALIIFSKNLKKMTY